MRQAFDSLIPDVMKEKFLAEYKELCLRHNLMIGGVYDWQPSLHDKLCVMEIDERFLNGMVYASLELKDDCD